MCCFARTQQENAQNHRGSCGCNAGDTPSPYREDTAPVESGLHAFPYAGRNGFFRPLQDIPYGYVKISLFHCFSFIISCSLMRARCNLERDVASVQPSSLAISLWEYPSSTYILNTVLASGGSSPIIRISSA